MSNLANQWVYWAYGSMGEESHSEEYDQPKKQMCHWKVWPHG